MMVTVLILSLVWAIRMTHKKGFVSGFFANLNFIVFLEGHISVSFIKSYQFNSYLPLIDNKTHLVATLEN